MDDIEERKTYTFEFTYLEAAYLNAAVVDFYHKMRAAIESEVPVVVLDERFKVTKSLWAKIEEQIPIGEWK